jgi:23S rRNA (uracil1939-C5)-methyltransferase
VTRARIAIESIAAGGDGIGRAEGLAVFVPRTAPGDVVDVELTSHGRFARGEIVELVEPSGVRVAPECAHYVKDRCGGCQLQHVAYDAQLAAKGRIIHDALARLGGRDLAAPEVAGSERRWRYRSKLTLAMRPRGRGWLMGLHPLHEPRRVFELHDCPITGEDVVAAWREIRTASPWLPRARELRGAVRRTSDGMAFVLEGGRAWPSLRDFLDACPSLAAVWWVPEHGTRRLVFDRRAAASPDASFGQVNPAVAAALHADVLRRARAHAPATVVDAYAGAGATAIPLANDGVRVTAIERDADAVRWLAARLPAGSRALAARVEDALPAALPAEVVLLNPPRTGLDAAVTSALVASVPRPRAILYVSCNPATLARDLARLPGWRVTALSAWDMFPQTAHVETVCELAPEDA